MGWTSPESCQQGWTPESVGVREREWGGAGRGVTASGVPTGLRVPQRDCPSQLCPSPPPAGVSSPQRSPKDRSTCPPFRSRAAPDRPVLQHPRLRVFADRALRSRGPCAFIRCGIPTPGVGHEGTSAPKTPDSELLLWKSENEGLRGFGLECGRGRGMTVIRLFY